MILNYDRLLLARANWQHDQELFDDAVTALESATCHADLRSTLHTPPYRFSRRLLKWHIYNVTALQTFMLGFELSETQTHTWVTIHL